ncbi:MAG: GAF domain-containing protein [Deltaproteobacteria bacterium]|nr:GAF domain-containing protein [Deltaproteobacteria bacterium]
MTRTEQPAGNGNGPRNEPRTDPSINPNLTASTSSTDRLPAGDVQLMLEEENRALEEAYRVSKRRLEAMRDVARAMAGRLDLDELLRTIIGKVGELCDCERASLFLVDDVRGEIWSRVSEGTEQTIRLPIGRGVAGSVAKSGIALNLSDAYQDPRFDASVDERTGYRTNSLLAVPILSPEGKTTGIVEALNKRVGPFGVEDERLLEAVAGEISVALKNALLFDEVKKSRAALERRVQELDLLVDVERALAGAESVDALVAVVMERARSLLAADASLVGLVEGASSIAVRASFGDGADRDRLRLVPLGTGLIGHAIAAEESARVADAASDPRHAAAIAGELGLKPGPFLVVPLLFLQGGSARAYGAVAVLRSQGREPFSADDERILALLGGRLAAALEEARRREKSKNEAQLERLGTMLAGIVHDLKTPMTVISGYVQLMAVEDDAKERQTNADTVLKNCDQMTSMIKELLQFVRGESSILIRKVFLQQFALEVEDMLRRLVAGKPGITLEVKLGYRGALRMDDLKMKRALANLAKNAIEAMGERGKLSFAVEQVGDQVEFAVADTGPGLPPEMEGRLFEQFATHGKKEGTGLGLALVKKIVDDHRGEVRVESKRGEGVTFRLRVPL